jgi:hypothetical protein
MAAYDFHSCAMGNTSMIFTVITMTYHRFLLLWISIPPPVGNAEIRWLGNLHHKTQPSHRVHSFDLDLCPVRTMSGISWELAVGEWVDIPRLSQL